MAVDRLGRPLRDDPYRGNVRVYSASNITLSGLQTIDGVVLESGDRVLCNGQTTASQNGVYVARTGAWSRARDLSTSDDFLGPILIAVEEGTTYRNTFWHMLPSTTIVVGTTAVAFVAGLPPVPPPDGDKGDLTVSSSGTVWSLKAGVVGETELADESVTFAKIVAMAEARILGRAVGAGTGDIGELTGAQVRTIADLNDTTRRVATRTAMASPDATAFPLVYLTEPGREGPFQRVTTNCSTLRTNDPGEGVFVPFASDTSGASGGFVRIRDLYQVWCEWFGVSASATPAANLTAINRAISFTKNHQAGGVVLVGGYYEVNGRIVHDGADIIVRGLNQNTGFYTTTAGNQLYKMTCMRGGIDTILLHYNVFTATTTDYCLWVENAVKAKFRDIRVYGGYYPLIISGTACADTEWTGCVFTFPTGPAISYMVRSGAGINGAHHFYRCLFNLDYPVSTPTSGSAFKGAWASSTVYAVGDLVTVAGGVYRLQCRVGGTSGTTEPSGTSVWFGTDIADGSTVRWRFVARADLVAALIDTGISWSYFSGCDFTGPFFYGARYQNSLAGDKPTNVDFLDGCTIHGPLFKAILMDSAFQCDISGLDTFGPYFANSIGIDITSGAEDITIDRLSARGFVDGVSIGGPHATVTDSAITGNTTGVRVKANTNDATITNNKLGTRTTGGANTNAIVVETGTSDGLVIIGNRFRNASTGLTNGATGTKNQIANNVVV